MASEENLDRDLAEQIFQAGVANFEGGSYQQALQQLEQAKSHAIPGTYQSGEIQVWLANAYDAVGRTEEAIALCRSLVKHPNIDVRKSARYVLSVLSAPQLRKLEGVTTEIPNLSNLDAHGNGGGYGSAGKNSSKSVSSPKDLPDALYTDADKQRIARRINQFLWVAGAIALLGLLAWIAH
ncbi:tetratricopeptide repeat protein [Tumidithrix helvetica PCC 7403]|uniref:hypothetical protein n=1 Tax=Tumidithrix helvetica TaxID=3457545 RepID=UPI003CBA94C0